MAAKGAEGPFLSDLLTRSGFAAGSDDISDDDGNEPGSDSGSVLSTQKINESDITNIYGNRAGGHGNEVPRSVRVPGADSGQQNVARAARPPLPGDKTGERAAGHSNARGAQKRTSRRPKRSRGGTCRRGGPQQHQHGPYGPKSSAEPIVYAAGLRESTIIEGARKNASAGGAGEMATFTLLRRSM